MDLGRLRDPTALQIWEPLDAGKLQPPVEQYEFLSAQIDRQTELLRELSETALYRERVEILQSIPGIGLMSAMELLLELQDVSRFRRAEQLAAYVGDAWKEGFLGFYSRGRSHKSFF